MNAPQQLLLEWIQGKTAELLEAIALAQGLGLADGATTVERLRDRILFRLEKTKVHDPTAAEQDFSSLRGRAETSGSRLSDVAWWLGCEESEESGRRELVGDSITAFLREYEPKIRRFVSSKFARGDADLAESVTDATFCHVYRYYWSRRGASKPSGKGRPRFLGEARAIGLLRTIARNEALAQLKDRRRFDEIDEGFVIPGPVGVNPTDEALEEKLSKALADCFEALPPRCKLVAWQRYRDGKQPSEIARDMGVGAPAVTNQCHRAVELLRSCLAGKGIQAGDIPCLSGDGGES